GAGVAAALEQRADIGSPAAPAGPRIASSGDAEHRLFEAGVPLGGERGGPFLRPGEQLAAQTLPPLGRIDAAHQLTAHAAVAVHAGVDVDGGEADQIPAAAQGEAVALQVEPGHGEPFADAGLLRRLAALVGPVDAVQ